MNKNFFTMFTMLIVSSCAYIEKGESISFASCEWEISTHYDLIEGESSEASFIYDDSRVQRTIDAYGANFDLLSKFDTTEYEVNREFSNETINFYDFNYIHEFAYQKKILRGFALQNKQGAIVFFSPKSEDLEKFLSSCLEPDLVSRLIKNY